MQTKSFTAEAADCRSEIDETSWWQQRSWNVAFLSPIIKAKEQDYPEENTVISEDTAEVKLQGLIDRTVSSQQVAVSSFSSSEWGNLVLVSKWGFDGSTGHFEYKQKRSGSFADSDLLLRPLLSNFAVCWKRAKEKLYGKSLVQHEQAIIDQHVSSLKKKLLTYPRQRRRL
jgi:hypothetical protein